VVNRILTLPDVFKTGRSEFKQRETRKLLF
jgi:hypothetical protein